MGLGRASRDLGHEHCLGDDRNWANTLRTKGVHPSTGEGDFRGICSSVLPADEVLLEPWPRVGDCARSLPAVLSDAKNR